MSGSGKRPRKSPGEIQPQAGAARTRRTPSVLGYLVILFAVAFLLLLMAYFQQQRSNAETNNALKESVSAVSAIQDMMESNKKLQEENTALQEEIDELKSQVASLDSSRRTQNLALEELSEQLAAMDYLWRIQRFYSKGMVDNARTLTDAFEQTGLPAALPRANPSELDGVSPLDQYNALLDAMGYRAEP